MKLSKLAFGLTSGIFAGIAIFLVTNYLLLIGAPGEFVSSLTNFCFGYSYSFLGSILGLIWGFIYGSIAGWVFAFLYNLFVKTS